jgi:hypothetical protein
MDQPIGPISPVVLYNTATSRASTASTTSPAASATTFNESTVTSPAHTLKEDGSVITGPPKKKQKRNKPTLSCEECVERKTKVR